jgi:GNAT superfamily N-acetyltransferase
MTPDLDLSLFTESLASQLGHPDSGPLTEELREDWTLRTDPSHAARYAAGCPVEGVAPADYMLRRLAIPGAGEVLAGIHFKGLDLAQPFVGVRAWSAPDAANLPALVSTLREAWAPFHPRSVQLFLPAGQAPPPAAILDQHLLVARVEDTRRLPPPPSRERVHLAPSQDAEALAAWVAQRYAEVHRLRPELAGLVTPADADDLRDCAAADALFEVEVEGQRAGLIAARPGRCLGHQGAEVVEELLDSGWWGQGLGPALQRAFVDALPQPLGPWVWGTIDGANQPSLRTALRTGRRVAGAWWFVLLE